jgi:hypothetical protein
MKTTVYEDQAAWLASRVGKITGSTLKNIIVKKKGTGEKIGYYQLIADVLAIPDDGENPMDRGHRLEEQAIERFTMETGLAVNTGHILWQRDDEQRIAVSPDGVISSEEAVALLYLREEEAVEAKCLSSAKHLEAYLTQEIPSEYKDQMLQYFVVNDNLQILHFVFFDPRIPCKDYFVLVFNRADYVDLIEEYLMIERLKFQQVDEIVIRLTSPS